MKSFIVPLSLAWLAGCTAVGVVQSGDPLRKLEDAEVLFESKDRPGPAEILIQEAVQIYRQRQDWLGLGHAYRAYGDLLKSASIAKWEGVYRRYGFRDKTITFDNRLEKAAEFYRMALESFGRAEEGLLESSRYDQLTNLYFNMGLTHHYLGEDTAACSYYSKSVEAAEQNRRQNPTIAPPEATISRAITAARNASNCGATPPNNSLERSRDP
jgi:tetratricopeptide (TPR) repeat protein